MATMPIYGKNLLPNQKSCDLETLHDHWGIKVYKVYINDDPRLTLTFFKAMSNFLFIVLIPQMSGERLQDLWSSGFHFHGPHPQRH